MKTEYLEVQKRLIRETFNDKRNISPEDSIQVDENIHQGGQIFIAENGELIDLELQLKDFDETELAKYVELAESLYEKSHERVSIYIVCPKNINVYVREFDIKSSADFTIKIYCSQEDPCEMILREIKNKMKAGEILDSSDIEIVKMLPEMCGKEDKHYYRVESFKILNRCPY